MKQLIDILHDEGLTLVVRSENGEYHRYTQRGVKDLLNLVSEHPNILKGAFIADKAVGKAAAACMAMGGVKQVYADVMSEPAMTLLQAHDIHFSYGQLVNHIINRSGTDWCPMERLSRYDDDPSIIINKIQQFFTTL